MNSVARSLVPILYRRSSVGYQSISTYKHGNSAPYLFLAFICTESRPYGPNLIIHELITAILQLAEEIGHELAPPLTLRNAPLPRTVSWVEDSVAFTPRCAAFLTRLNIPSGACPFYIVSMSIDINYNQSIHARMSLPVGLEDFLIRSRRFRILQLPKIKIELYCLHQD